MIYGIAANIKVIEFESELEVDLTLNIVSNKFNFYSSIFISRFMFP
ncbi:hypothetical protein JCM19297_3086 [Nonlabens ulvanivorans]|nr:hypothetical protein JCM19297_3086 [Nonlabens ulvanivorans]